MAVTFPQTMPSFHKHAPWRKALLVPCWTIQIFFLLFSIALYALVVGVIVSWDKTNDVNDHTYFDDAAEEGARIIIPIYIVLDVICLVLTITEIILLARHKLTPKVFVIMNSVKSGIWTAVFIFHIVAAVGASTRLTSIIGLVIEAVIFLSFWIPLIYGSRIYHRSRKAGKYHSIEDPSWKTTDIIPLTHPSQYKHFGADDHTESTLGTSRGSLHDQQGDVGFESYMHERTGFPDPNTVKRQTRSPLFPEVYAQPHDGEMVYEMESSGQNFI